MSDDNRKRSSNDARTPHDAICGRLAKLTTARIGTRRAGASLATAPLLEFKLAHALARAPCTKRSTSRLKPTSLRWAAVIPITSAVEIGRAI